jgi:LysM repeat protein
LRKGIPSGDHLRKAVLLLVVTIMISGCATFSEQLEKLRDWGSGLYTESEQEPSAPQGTKEPKSTAFYVHTVRWPGESLSIISKWYTGNTDQWSAIAQANPALDPNRIRVGMKIRIPKNIMTNAKPMPKEFVASFYPETTKGTGKAKPAKPPKDSEPKLIGPKSYSDQ